MTAEAVIASACSSDVGEALELLAGGACAAEPDLACACVTGDADVVAAHLAEDPRAARRPVGPFGWEPILYACFTRLPRVQSDRRTGVRAVVRVLLDAGADPNAFFEHDGWLQVALYGAAGILNDVELTQSLLEAGADPTDDRDGLHGNEVLYHACEFADPTCARLVIDAGARQDHVDYDLGRALNFPHEEMVEMFCRHGALADAGHLHQAVWRRRPPQTIAMLLDAGAPIDEPDSHGLTPLAIAQMWGDDAVAAVFGSRGTRASPATGGPPPLDEMLQIAIQQGDLDVVRRLLSAGAAIDGSGIDAPIAQACWRGQVEVVRELVSRGALLRWEGGSALGAARHGSRNCHHPEGGPTMQTVQEIDQDRYDEVIRILENAGAY